VDDGRTVLGGATVWGDRAMSATDDERLIRTVFERASQGRSLMSVDLLHPDAVVVPHTDPPVALTAAETVEMVRRYHRESPVYEAHAHAIRRIGEGRYVVVGRTRISRGHNGFVDDPAAWAIVIKDDKLFRVKGTATEGEAARVIEADDWSPAVGGSEAT
jgi:hypothetical protein